MRQVLASPRGGQRSAIRLGQGCDLVMTKVVGSEILMSTFTSYPSFNVNAPSTTQLGTGELVLALLGAMLAWACITNLVNLTAVLKTAGPAAATSVCSGIKELT